MIYLLFVLLSLSLFYLLIKSKNSFLASLSVLYIPLNDDVVVSPSVFIPLISIHKCLAFIIINPLGFNLSSKYVAISSVNFSCTCGLCANIFTVLENLLNPAILPFGM